MNHTISVIFRAIPLAMAAFCLGFGAFVLASGHDVARVVAGPVIISLAMICVALFSTAATIIRQIIHTYSRFFEWALPVLGYTAGVGTIVAGAVMLTRVDDGPRLADGPHFVAAHVVIGVGCIACCVATAATASTRFTLVPRNARSTSAAVPEQAFGTGAARVLVAVPVAMAAVTWVWGLGLVVTADGRAPHFIAGHVMCGLACICTSLIALVASIVRQIRNTYTEAGKTRWPWLVFAMAAVATVWGLYVIIRWAGDPAIHVIGYILIGLGLVCASISSKVVLLAKIWHQDFPLANRIPLIPVGTALTCLFLAAFLFEEASMNPNYFIPARVVTGLGAICFTLFSIVSILESGTSQNVEEAEQALAGPGH